MPNRLQHSASLYLRKHADNPIDWWPWCPEALETAAARNCPIFVSIGYSSCHWCTVMEGEAFSDLAIATFLNEHFLCIKIDREERPDLDSIYMQALQAMVGQGGWPLNIFLQPRSLIPFYGGTYFPVEPRYGRRGFLEILQALLHFFTNEPEKLAQQTSQMQTYLAATTELEANGNLTPSLMQQGFEAIVMMVDRHGQGQQFPMMPYAQTALRGSRFVTGARDRAIERGLDLALGGIFDHVGGGWHRYTVDPTWTVPHFEKMLYDNGQILEFVADLWAAGMQDPALVRAADRTVAWLRREMTAPAGYFYAAQDADSFMTPEAQEPEEGDFYVWQVPELTAALTETELSALKEHFDLRPNFRDRPGYIVLQRVQEGILADIVESALTKLFAIRYGSADVPQFPPAPDAVTAKTYSWPGRIPPVTDTKLIVAWNALMISGLTRAATAWSRPAYLDLALGAATFIWEKQQCEAGLLRLNYDGTACEAAKAEDYAFLVKAYLDLHQATFEPLWLERAIAIQADMDTALWDSEAGGYFSAPAAPDLVIREKDYQDNAVPAANGVAIANLVRLAILTEGLNYLDRAETALITFSGVMAKYPRACPSLWVAWDWLMHNGLVKTPTALRQEYWPTTIWLPAADSTTLCLTFKCLPPLADTATLRAKLHQAQTRFLKTL